MLVTGWCSWWQPVAALRVLDMRKERGAGRFQPAPALLPSDMDRHPRPLIAGAGAYDGRRQVTGQQLIITTYSYSILEGTIQGKSNPANTARPGRDGAVPMLLPPALPPALPP